MRSAIGLSAAFAFGACCTAAQGSPLLSACETALLARLAAPASYQPISISKETTVPTASGPVRYSVSILYQALNAFGQPVAGSAACDYVDDRGAGVDQVTPEAVMINGLTMASWSATHLPPG